MKKNPNSSLPSRPKFTYDNTKAVFHWLISGWPELATYYFVEIDSIYNQGEERLPYYDMGRLAHFIGSKYISNDTGRFKHFFGQLEAIFSNCDDQVVNLLKVGLFEALQNNNGGINYYTAYHPWLQKRSLEHYEGLIEGWEGQDWRKNAENWGKS